MFPNIPYGRFNPRTVEVNIDNAVNEQKRLGVLPSLLSRDDTYWFLRHCWQKCEPPRNQHWAAIVCNESGRGKSYLSMGVAYPQYPDFNPSESIAFTPDDFARIAAEKHPRHFPLILDDAGLSAFSGDALNVKVKRISKIAQSIRHKHWQIILNLPTFELMARSVRVTNHYYLEPVWIDYDKKITHTRFQRLKVHPFTGDAKRVNMRKTYLVENEVTGYTEAHKDVIVTVPVPKVPDVISRQYENLASEFKNKFAKDTSNEMISARNREAKKEGKLSANDIKSIIESEPFEFIEDGRYDWFAIQKKFKDQMLSDSHCMNIARSLNRNNGIPTIRRKVQGVEEPVAE